MYEDNGKVTKPILSLNRLTGQVNCILDAQNHARTDKEKYRLDKLLSK